MKSLVNNTTQLTSTKLTGTRTSLPTEFFLFLFRILVNTLLILVICAAAPTFSLPLHRLGFGRFPTITDIRVAVVTPRPPSAIILTLALTEIATLIQTLLAIIIVSNVRIVINTTPRKTETKVLVNSQHIM